jgi:hypothetical protein
MYLCAVLEKELYDSVERFARKTLGCFAAAQNTGLRAGRIDVVGLRDIGGNLEGAGEVLAIEVKRGMQPFLVAVGQAAAYSVYADRCYLADIRPSGFTNEEKTIAVRLGVGLLQIKVGRRTAISEDLIAPTAAPLANLRLELIERLHFSLCTICTGFFERGADGQFRANVEAQKERGDYRKRAVDGGRGIMFWLDEQEGRRGTGDDVIRKRRYICKDCTRALFG